MNTGKAQNAALRAAPGGRVPGGEKERAGAEQRPLGTRGQWARWQKPPVVTNTAPGTARPQHEPGGPGPAEQTQQQNSS